MVLKLLSLLEEEVSKDSSDEAMLDDASRFSVVEEEGMAGDMSHKYDGGGRCLSPKFCLFHTQLIPKTRPAASVVYAHMLSTNGSGGFSNNLTDSSSRGVRKGSGRKEILCASLRLQVEVLTSIDSGERFRTALKWVSTMTEKMKGDEILSERKRRRSHFYMLLLTLQYGAQPLLTQHFSGRTVIMTSVVLTTELIKIFVAVVALIFEGKLGSLKKEWSFADAVSGSALPATIYAIQNSLIQLSYRHLDSLTATMLNQTKLVFTALFMFLILGQRQTKQQVGALMLLIVAATLLSFSQKSPKASAAVPQNSFVLGVIPIIVASVLSGLASSLCQWAVQVKKRSTYLMTIEMSAIGAFCLAASLSRSPDGVAIAEKGFFHGWNLMTFVPVTSNALGGILVGLVTMYAGGVKKGFVIVSALLVTALLQVIVDGAMPSWLVFAALPLVVTSTIIHQRYPYVPKKKAE
ncbi:hypothetical protein R1sor_015121 [Riccia sorocarpa]|uniref:Nucleotide-sugar transporter n=1 Tax=Riccia sorocarpa TaxID=122646 RepID=A0ABD3HEC5_9MARC